MSIFEEISATYKKRDEILTKIVEMYLDNLFDSGLATVDVSHLPREVRDFMHTHRNVLHSGHCVRYNHRTGRATAHDPLFSPMGRTKSFFARLNNRAKRAYARLQTA